MKRVVLAWFAIALAGIVANVACSSSLRVTTTEAADSGAPEEPGSDGGIDEAPDAKTDASPNGIGTPCDPIAQDCTGAFAKCTYANVAADGDRANYAPVCEISTGLPGAEEGDACARSAPGIDNCSKGSHCFPDGAAGFVCRRICAEDSQCDDGSRCAAVTSQAPLYGVCFPTCFPFTSDCSGGTCANYFGDTDATKGFEGCRATGPGTAGTKCTAQSDCAANMNCYGKPTFVCTPMCDADHSCGESPCVAIPGSDGGGLCEP